MRTKTMVLAALFAVGCNSSPGNGGNPDLAVPGGGGDMAMPGGGDMAMPGGGGDMAAPPGDMAFNTSGAGSVSGSLGGSPFGTPQTAWMIGHPDVATTTVIYIFNAAVTCHDAAVMFGMMGWDQNLPASTQILEMKLFGNATTPPTMPGAYTAVTTATPGPGEATCNHSLTHGGTASTESAATGGTVTLSTIVDKTSATGSFTLNFATGSFNGTFNAGYCDIGVEP